MPASPSPWTASVLTLYPDMFPGMLGHALAGRALKKNIWCLETINIRDFAADPHRTVDDTPYGGGAGMVLRPDILGMALESVAFTNRPCYILSPRGKPLHQALVREMARNTAGVVLVCGHFEGIDQRFSDHYKIPELSVGDYVLSGGEAAAQVVLDAAVRLLPGVIGAAESLDEESFSASLLEYPHYTRPAEWKGLKIPEILLSGHHDRIQRWRQSQAETVTQQRRPDLWEGFEKRKKKL